MGISQYTFIKKERRAEWDRIPGQHRQEERLLLWQGDRGNAAAEVILDEKAEDLELIADPVMNEKENLSYAGGDAAASFRLRRTENAGDHCGAGRNGFAHGGQRIR